MDNSMENKEKEKLQWIKGDKIGSVETINTTEGDWTVFDSGGRISTNLIKEFLQPVIGTPLDFSNTPTQPPTIKKGKNKTKASKSATSSPIRTLFDKQKKNDKIKLNLTFPIEVPKKDIYEIISSSFDSVEVNSELESFIQEQISQDFIKDSLIQSIKELIKTRYDIN
jgi:hypothetical protein